MAKVELYLYDLSQGMAKSMSLQLLGKQLDGVWHTGIVVFGYEYFFGGGIQSAAPGTTVAGAPQLKIDLGTTQRSQAAFHEFLQSVSHRFTQATYNLMKNNCNGFTDACAIFLTGKPIPSYITNLPNEALNSPMGAMFMPYLEQMQSKIAAGNGGGPIPWGNASLNLPPIRDHSSSSPSSSASQSSAPGSSSASSAPVPDVPPSRMSISQLKAALTARGISLAGLAEKADLVSRLEAAIADAGDVSGTNHTSHSSRYASAAAADSSAPSSCAPSCAPSSAPSVNASATDPRGSGGCSGAGKCATACGGTSSSASPSPSTGMSGDPSSAASSSSSATPGATKDFASMDAATMSVSQLKAALAAYGASSAGLVEKQDFVRRVRELQLGATEVKQN